MEHEAYFSGYKLVAVINGSISPGTCKLVSRNGNEFKSAAVRGKWDFGL